MKKVLILKALILTAALYVAPAFAEEAAPGKHEAEEKEHFKPLYPPKTADKSFSTLPAKPVLVGPKFFAKITQTATLSWQPTDNATAYHFQLATDPNFKWLVANEELYKKIEFVASQLEANKHYYWRVAAIKEGNNPGYQKSAFAVSMFETN